MPIADLLPPVASNGQPGVAQTAVNHGLVAQHQYLAIERADGFLTQGDKSSASPHVDQDRLISFLTVGASSALCMEHVQVQPSQVSLEMRGTGGPIALKQGSRHSKLTA